jgi:hypothetical protein
MSYSIFYYLYLLLLEYLLTINKIKLLLPMLKNKSPNALSGKIITIHRGLAIYKINASPYWMCRIRDGKNKKNIVRSTKETSRIEARRAAQELFESIFSTGALDSVPRQYRFDYFADLLLKQTLADIEQGRRAKSLYKDIKYVLQNKDRGLLKEFGHRDVRELVTRDFTAFIRKVMEHRKDLSASTHNQLRTAFRKVMRIALLEGAIQFVPDAPKLNNSRPTSRTFFRFHPLVSKDKDEYQLVLKTAERMKYEGVKVRGISVTEELRDIILFTVHSFVRPTVSELYAIKHADVTAANEPRRLLITIRKGKTGHRIIDTMEAAVSVYERIAKRNKARSGPDDYIFLPQYRNRETAKRVVMRQFNQLLNIANLKSDIYTEQTHSMYSLRHTCLCMRLVLSEGKVNLFALAKNSGTSVEMLQNFYLRNLPNTSELARNLQSFGNS